MSFNPAQKAAEISESFMSFWKYWNKEVNLCDAFSAKNDQNKDISKNEFIEMLMSGNYLPIRIPQYDSSLQYVLVGIPKTVDPAIISTIQQMAGYEKVHLSIENKLFPDFEGLDLNNIQWSRSRMEGWFMVIKTWFIKCGPCEQQRPAFEDLMQKYSNKNVGFISFADDERSELSKFNEVHDVKYTIIPEQGQFIRNSLGLSSYPTYLLVDTQGIVLKVSNDLKCISNELLHRAKYLNDLPPPPGAN
ncbi:MAG TPA: TlpA disulfide reductase family protein [Phnomibacter sp.]|nr:TlpA disulfide reductase family protein [Phnomibacter sp.]